MWTCPEWVSSLTVKAPIAAVGAVPGVGVGGLLGQHCVSSPENAGSTRGLAGAMSEAATTCSSQSQVLAEKKGRAVRWVHAPALLFPFSKRKSLKCDCALGNTSVNPDVGQIHRKTGCVVVMAAQIKVNSPLKTGTSYIKLESFPETPWPERAIHALAGFWKNHSSPKPAGTEPTMHLASRRAWGSAEGCRVPLPVRVGVGSLGACPGSALPLVLPCAVKNLFVREQPLFLGLT